jgi:hypothetical protein
MPFLGFGLCKHFYRESFLILERLSGRTDRDRPLRFDHCYSHLDLRSRNHPRRNLLQMMNPSYRRLWFTPNTQIRYVEEELLDV